MPLGRLRVNRPIWFAITFVTTVTAGTWQIDAAPTLPHSAALIDFQQRVNGYITLHNRVAAKLGPLDSSRSQADIAARAAAMAKALRVARAGARRGDILTPEAGHLFRVMIRRQLAHRRVLPRADRDEPPGERPEFTPVVNQIYPTSEPLAMVPPGVLRDLPALPDALEYRFVRTHLILRDREANLIVDVLPSAAPPP